MGDHAGSIPVIRIVTIPSHFCGGFYFIPIYDGNLVIPFDKYEISPGYMGTPEFVIDKKIIKDTLKDEFKAILNQ